MPSLWATPQGLTRTKHPRKKGEEGKSVGEGEGEWQRYHIPCVHNASDVWRRTKRGGRSGQRQQGKEMWCSFNTGEKIEGFWICEWTAAGVEGIYARFLTWDHYWLWIIPLRTSTELHTWEKCVQSARKGHMRALQPLTLCQQFRQEQVLSREWD